MFSILISILNFFLTDVLSHSVMSDSATTWRPARLLRSWAFPCKNLGLGCHFLLQGIFLSQGSNVSVLYLYHWVTGNIDIEIVVAQSCPTLCDSMDCSLPGSSLHGIFQARVLEWVAISFSRRSSRPRDQTRVSRIVGRCFTIWATREVHL